MLTLEGLKRSIRTAEDLHSVVKTMKALAAVNIRQFQQALNSLTDYSRTIEQGFQVLLQQPGASFSKPRQAATNKLAAIVFGSDQGMCGPLNEQIATYLDNQLSERNQSKEDTRVLVIGTRLAGRLEDLGYRVQVPFALPTTVARVTPAVQTTLLTIDGWTEGRGVDHILLCYCQHLSSGSYAPKSLELLPLDVRWLETLKKQKWPGPSLPTFTLDADALFSRLVHQYLFVSLFRAFVESLASENASRLLSMQAAERNIADRLEDLTSLYHQERQMAITGEILDIVSGFEALSTSSEN
ncbi:MAG: F0F1 ATP synthase subunit gamma [Gemmataceae bacterium]